MSGVNQQARTTAGCPDLKGMALQELLERVAWNGEAEALHELLARRPLFRRTGWGALLLGDYVRQLWEEALSRRHAEAAAVLDAAHDLTMDKFCNLPDMSDTVKRPGPDCRFYYRAFLKKLHEDGAVAGCGSRIKLEYEMAWQLQRFVDRHFLLSLLEARRAANPTVSRYAWSANGKGVITVWLPKSMKGPERRKWLEEHIADINPDAPGERERVQAIIDKRLARSRLVPFDQAEKSLAGQAGWPATWVGDHPEPAPSSFPEYIAQEKAASVELQRPAIRALGSGRLAALVRVVFDNLLGRERTEEEIATAFGLSKSAYSRFAGSRWNGAERGERGTIPDLWMNVSHELATNPVFVDVARQAGVFGAARAAADGGHGCRLRSRNDA